MVEINWTRQALADLNDIGEYIAKDSEKYASIQVGLLYNKPEVLKSNIRLGRIVPEMDQKSIRELILGNYRIVYRIVSEKRIDIITVHHSARLLSNNPAFKK